MTPLQPGFQEIWFESTCLELRIDDEAAAADATIKPLPDREEYL